MVLFGGALCVCAGDLPDGKKLALIGQEIEARQCPLYRAVRSELERYYDRTDFSDPGRRTGWYRVDSFLKWLELNEKKLKRERVFFYYEKIDKKQLKEEGTTLRARIRAKAPSVCTLLKGKTARIGDVYSWKALSTYLGARYAADLFLPEYRRFPPVGVIAEDRSGGIASVSSVPDGMKAKRVRSVIAVGSKKNSFAEDINLGLHEGTHLLRWMNMMPGLVSEVGSFYAQVTYGLPIKATEEKFCFSRGSRNFIHSVRELGSCTPLSDEYAEMLLGALMFTNLKQPDLINWLVEKRSDTVTRLMNDLAAQIQGVLFHPEKPEKLPWEAVYERYQTWFSVGESDINPGATYGRFFSLLSPASSEKREGVLLARTAYNGWDVRHLTRPVTLREYVEELPVPKALSKETLKTLSDLAAAWSKEGSLPVPSRPRIPRAWWKGESAEIGQPLDEQAERFLREYIAGCQAGLPPVPKGYL